MPGSLCYLCECEWPTNQLTWDWQCPECHPPEGKVMAEKSLGQIAYEEYRKHHPYKPTWQELSFTGKQTWEEVGNAVGQAVWATEGST